MISSHGLIDRSQSPHVDAHRPPVRVRRMPEAIQRQERAETSHGLDKPRHELDSSESQACASLHD